MGHARKRKATRRQAEPLKLKAESRGWVTQRVAEKLPSGLSVVVYQTTLRSGGQAVHGMSLDD